MSDVRATEESLRTRAIAVLKKRRDFRAHLLVYVLVNAGLVSIWAATSADGCFWPLGPIVFWGVGVVMNAWDAWYGDDFSEDKIEHQMHRLASRR